ncbi:MAG: hypothetical protein ACK5PB_13190 [Pirellula sp.]|jgi:hypothetical protein
MTTDVLSRCMAGAVAWILIGCLGVLHASNPWSSEVGEAKDVQRTAAEITRLLNEEHPFSPAADIARLLEQQSSQLLRIVRDGADWNRIIVSLKNTKAVFCNLNVVVNQDCKTRDDRSLQRSIEAFDRRFNRLESALVNRYKKLNPPFCPPVIRRPPIHIPPIHEPPVRILPILRQPAPLPPFHHFPPSYYHREDIPSGMPNNRVELSREQSYQREISYRNDHRRDQTAPVIRSAGRQIMSVVISELVNRL